MSTDLRPSWVTGLLPLILVLVLSVLGLHNLSTGQVPQGPFANSVEVQLEIVNQLKAMNALLKEQNNLLRAGPLKVVVVEPGKS